MANPDPNRLTWVPKETVTHLRPIGQRQLRHAERGRLRRQQQVALRRILLLLLRRLLSSLLLLLMLRLLTMLLVLLLMLLLLLLRDAGRTLPGVEVGVLRRRRWHAPVELRVRCRRGRRGRQQPLRHARICSHSAAA